MAAVFPASLVAAPRGGSPSWHGDYETGNFSQWVEVQAVRGAGTYTTSSVGGSEADIVRAPVRQGRYAARFVIHGGSPLASDRTARAEVYASGANTGSYNGQTWYYAWSTYIPAESWPNWTANFNVIETIGHGQPNGYPIPLSIGVDATGTTPHLYAENQDINGNDLNVTNIGDLATGQWIDFVARIDWTTSTTGRVQLWRNGVLVLDTTGNQTLNPANADGTSYWKEGVYIGDPYSTAPWPTDLTVYHECARRGDSFAAVTGTTC